MTDSLGIDFGTTNTVMARLRANGDIENLQFPFETSSDETLRTALSFHRDPTGTTAAAGSRAVQQFIDDPWETRFLQSIKTFAASPQFTGTSIFAKRFSFEDLMERFLDCAFDYAAGQLNGPPKRVVMGRPVAFAGSQPDEKLAIARYDKALQNLGTTSITYVYEPVAAAYFYVRDITTPCTVLVADFGGGTSDFSVVRFGFDRGKRVAQPLGHSGIAIAGDQFDYRIIDQVLLPLLGKGSRYRSMSGTFELPRSPFTSFARWNQLSILKTSREFADLKKLLRDCESADRVEKLIDLVEENQGYPLYKAVSEAKAQLSASATTTLKFAPMGRDFEVELSRAQFDCWIAEDLRRITETLDDALKNANLSPRDIDRVFLTGGTSLVPAVRAIFDTRFEVSKIAGGNEFNAIAKGLALIAADDAPAFIVT
jgi:hypothetical chaperone protein